MLEFKFKFHVWTDILTEWSIKHVKLYGGHFENGGHLEWAGTILGPLLLEIYMV
jgi:hypothetical protein